KLSSEAVQPLATLDAEQLDALHVAVVAARKRQRELLETAITQALDHLPRLLRGPVLKILGHRR
ncbi:MAG: hypothetical protein ABF296_05210, partial [Oceanococcaceae bacterium]